MIDKNLMWMDSRAWDDGRVEMAEWLKVLENEIQKLEAENKQLREVINEIETDTSDAMQEGWDACYQACKQINRMIKKLKGGEE